MPLRLFFLIDRDMEEKLSFTKPNIGTLVNLEIAKIRYILGVPRKTFITTSSGTKGDFCWNTLYV